MPLNQAGCRIASNSISLPDGCAGRTCLQVPAVGRVCFWLLRSRVPETLAHLQLKRLAAATLLRWGCQAAATEVLCPISRYRVDAAGWLDAEPHSATHNHLAGWTGGQSRADEPESGHSEHVSQTPNSSVLRATTHPPPAAEPAGDRRATPLPPRTRCEPRTVIIECKQSRADFLRDRDNLEALLKARDELEGRRTRFADRVRELEPHLQSTHGVLFAEMGEWNLAASTNPTYRRILRELEKIDERLHGGTKFHRLARYRLADRLYLLAPAGVVGRREVPPGWGLIECPRQWSKFRRASLVALSEVEVHVAAEAPRHVSPARRKERLLRNIAVALTRGAVRTSMEASAAPPRPRQAAAPTTRPPGPESPLDLFQR